MTTMYPPPGAVAVPVPPLEGPWLPRRGEPGWTMWPRGVWPLNPLAAAPRRLVLLTVVAAVLGSALWRPTLLSIGYLAVGIIFFAAVYGACGTRPTAPEWSGIALTLALLVVPGVLAADWVGVLCIMAAWVTAWCTLAAGRTWTAVVVGPFMPWALPPRVSGWLRRTPVRGHDTHNLLRVAVVLGISVLLVLVFGGLFASADPAFAHVFTALMPDVDGLDVVARVFVFGLVFSGVLCAAYLLRFRPRLDKLAPTPGRPVPTWEWAVPLAVLDVLFAAFVVVQATVLFGGHQHVLETAGLTYAEYARQGFWQLLGVSTLTLVVLSVALRKAGRTARADRLLIRTLIGILCATSIVVVISAILRMWVYQQAYGFSIERLLVISIEVWLGAVFVLVAVCGIRMSAHWLPRAVLVAGAAVLLGLAALNPERLIAERNIDRYEQIGQLDVQFLSGLSSDIDPALQRLPADVRACITRRPGHNPEPWYQFNVSRSRAGAAVEPSPETCPRYDEFWFGSR